MIRIAAVTKARRGIAWKSGLVVATAMCGLVLAGCGGAQPVESKSPGAGLVDENRPGGNSSTARSDAANTATADSRQTDSRRTFQPVRLGGPSSAAAGGRAGSSASNPSATGGRFADPNADPAFAALKKLQVVLGQWRGTTRRKFDDGFNSIEQAEWAWDLLSDKSRPALALKAEDSPYLRAARLTYDPVSQLYRLAATDADGEQRIYDGAFLEEPQLVPGDDPRQLQWTFKLELTQVEPPDAKKLARVVFNQQNNNRYLVELHERRGSRLAQFDVIANQRQGTSFALADDDYGERTCIISEGLGTMTVSHAGRTYYVCCTGCKAAFEDDPAHWIARASERAKAKKNE